MGTRRISVDDHRRERERGFSLLIPSFRVANFADSRETKVVRVFG